MAEPKFEKDLEKLEQVVEALEAGGLSLDDALKRFEEGIKLARRCEKALADAERRIEILTKNSQGEIVAEPFADAEDEEDASSGDDDASSGKDEASSSTDGRGGKSKGGTKGELLF